MCLFSISLLQTKTQFPNAALEIQDISKESFVNFRTAVTFAFLIRLFALQLLWMQ